ncbi:outer membrane beta-barrel protein [Agaribacter flavus]|uniref:Outer membrane beta-barrel protein n=1 Tax=Agaribacter flavus TaxID=1902781 RepID=A0ABV7FPC5_9ALTE
MLKKITTILVLAMSAEAASQDAFQPSSTPVGSFDFTPTIDLGLSYDDNVTRVSSDQIDSWSRLVAPRFRLVTSTGVSDLSFQYRLVNEDFFSSDADNYNDHFLSGSANVELDARNRIIVSASYEDGHDDRDSNFSIGLGDSLLEPDQYKRSAFDVKYSYGALNADGRLSLNLNVVDQNYDLNTPRYLARDRKFSTIGGVFNYAVAPSVDMVIDLSRIYVDYKFALNTLNPLDSKQDSLLVGIEWAATAKTSGFAKLGYQTKDFDSATREDFSGVDWALGVLWEPLSYSSIEFTTMSDTNETNGEGNFIRRNAHSAEWKHSWLERLQSGVRLTLSNDRYEGQLINGLDVRTDDVLGLRTSIDYIARRWLKVSLAYSYSERDSNRDVIDFDKNKISLTASVGL